MAEECAYYYYDAGYSCALKREKEGRSSIDSDTVHRYCWGYHYNDCPRYREKHGSGGGCFLTSACVEAKGLPDDCEELQTLRKFRDEYLAKQECGSCEIKHYYQVAPAIVDAINKLPNKAEIWDQIYTRLILCCVEWIQTGENEKAYNTYKRAVIELKEKYIKEEEK